MHKHWKSLQFIILIPVLVFLVLAGTGLYLLMSRSIEEFANERIFEHLNSLSDAAYRMADVEVDRLNKQGAAAQDTVLNTISQVSVLESYEVFARQNEIELVIHDTDRNSIAFQSSQILDAELVVSKALNVETQTFESAEGENYFLNSVDFRPWNWKIVLVKDSAAFSALTRKVRNIYLGIGFAIALMAIGLTLYLRQAIGRPINHIVKRLGLRHPPNYRGIAEFEFLSNGIGEMMDEISMHNEQLEEQVKQRTKQLEQASRDAEIAKSQLSEAIESISEGFSLYDSDDRVVMTNTRYLDLMYPDNPHVDLIGKKFTTVIANALDNDSIPVKNNEKPEWFRTRIARHLNPGEPFVLQRSNGVWIRISERKTKAGGIVAIYTDISDIISNELALKTAKEQAESANEAKSTFLATMSHEIRTPMNGVIGMTNLLLDTELDQEQTELGMTIQDSAESLLTVINDILDFSKVEAGKLDLENKPFDIGECIEAAMDVVATKAAEKHLELAYLLDPTMPSAIYGDSSRLRQILLNLLNNAIKFTENGEVVLTVDIVDTQQNKLMNAKIGNHQLCQFKFSVRDTGIGIPADRIDRLFHSFSQVDASTTRRYGGTGLGLAISKHLVQLMGGEIWAESEDGVGTTIHFSLQAELAKPVAKAERKALLPKLSGKKLLVVDDNETNLKVLELQTQAWEMQPVLFTSPVEALTWVRTGESFDVAVLDMSMPDMSGLDLALALRERYTPSQLPIILLSSIGGNNLESDQAKKAAFTAMLQKPLKPSALFSALIEIFTGGPINVLRNSHRKKVDYDTTMAQRVPLRILVAEDHPTNQILCTKVLGRLGYAADVSNNGLEVLAALSNEKYDVVLMDVEMPEMDGLEATRQIRRRWPNNGRPHIIAMTANAMRGDRDVCLAVGMDDYLSKPLRVASLVTALESVLPVQKAQKDASSVVHGFRSNDACIDQVSVSTSSIDQEALSQLREAIGGDPEDLVEMIDSFLNDGSVLMAGLRKAVTESNITLLKREAHKMKGSARDFGATQLAALCLKLESIGKQSNSQQLHELVEQAEAAFRVATSELTIYREQHTISTVS